jgi:GNAT superfamily N-acetyltransferase
VRRFVFPALSDEIARLGRAIDEPFVYLKACAPAEALRRVLGRPWSVADPSYMMTLSVLERPRPLAPQGYRLTIDGSPLRATAAVEAGDTVVASGHVVVIDDLAIFDRILTHPDHQRRGLGTLVMTALGQAAGELKARRGALVATKAGRGLYESLGWRLHCLYASAVIPGQTAVQLL